MFREVTFLEKGLEQTHLRQRLLANNIANVDTPGYQRQDLSFAQYLRIRKNLTGEVTHAAHLAFPQSPKGIGFNGPGTRGRNDGNNVDIEREMAELVKNSLYAQALSRQTSQYLVNLKRVISEGRR